MVNVSIIVPVYNVENYLKRCLDSILKQTYTDFEIICVDDCSSDCSQDILEDYGEKYPEKITVLYNKVNSGQGKSRESALKIAKGDYIIFIDSDDYIKNDYIETYMREMKSNPCDVIVGGYVRDIDGKMKLHKSPNGIWSVSTYVLSWAKMFSKKYIETYNIGFSDIRIGEDIYFTMDMFCNDFTYRVIDYEGYYYYLNKNSTTGSLQHDKRLEVSVSQMFNLLLGKYDMKRLPLEKYQVVEYTYIANMVNALITYGRGCKVKKMKKKYEFFRKDLEIKFPNYKKNPYFKINNAKGQTNKIKLAVSVFALLDKLHLDRVMFYIMSLI